jgi:hypothetical protein
MDNKMATDLLRASLIRKELVDDSQTTCYATPVPIQLSTINIIIQAASYMNQTGIYVATYVSPLERQENEMVELLSQDFEDMQGSTTRWLSRGSFLFVKFRD